MTEPPLRQRGLMALIGLLARRRRLVLAPALACVAAALVLSSMHTKVYEAHTDVLLRARTDETPFDPRTGAARDTARVVDTEAKLATGTSVRAGVADRLGLAPSASAAAVTGTNVIRIAARAGQPGQAADIANAYADSYIADRRTRTVNNLLTVVAETQRQLAAVGRRIDALGDAASTSSERTALIDQQASLRQTADELQVSAALRTGGAQLLTAATPSSTPVEPTPAVTGVLAFLAGLLLGAAAALVAEYLDDSISTPTALRRADHGVPIVGAIPAVRGWRRRGEARLVTHTDPTSAAAEAYRALRTAIRFLHLGRPMQILQVTSPNAGEGKTSTLANLAVTMAGTGQRVCVVCCDLRRPRVHEFFGAERSIGVTSVLTGHTPLSEALQPATDVPGLYVLAAGPTPPNPAEVLASDALDQIFDELKSMFDVVLVDSPPLLPVTDAAVVSWRADIVLVVVSAGRTTRRALSRAIEVLEQVHAPVAGIVVNEAPSAFVSRLTSPDPRSEALPSGHDLDDLAGESVPSR